ncbi:hypothetical protein B0T10DRAFT_554090 [Thelonectria olida]|uniref:Uncharacterized protein n=1 Tax=Thelonectria olida TaxID=1576542 RepID=A0A9P8VQM3_9HYPO|nr:hypothetical protein B0T10DRAFT_554090 [Thelonectria olida]
MADPSPSTSNNDSATNAWVELHGTWNKTDSATMSYVCRTIYVVAGRGVQQVAFPFPAFCLEQSPVIKEWIFYPYIEPPSIRRDGNFYFEDWSPKVVKGILFSLLSWRDGQSELLPRCDFWIKETNPQYFVKFYLLAASLGMDWACPQALRALDRTTLNRLTLQSIIEMDEFEKLLNLRSFTSWMSRKMLENPEIATNPMSFKNASRNIEVLLAHIKHLHEDLKRDQSREQAIRAILNGP